MHQFFICNQNEVDLKLKKLTKTGTSDDGWTNFYIDEDKSEYWLLTQYNSEYHGGGVPVLKRLPEPTVDELIDIAMTSADTNNIIGASLELSEREKYNKEDFRHRLINRLLQVDTSDLPDFEKERLRIIIYESDLYDATNRRDTIGKHYTEIQKDADYFRLNAQIAKEILENVKKYSS
jgi:hypothetical protein